MSIKAIDLRRGMAVNMKNGVWVCISNDKVAKGNWRSYQVIQLKNVTTGQLIEDRYRTDEPFEQAILERKPMTYMYSEPQNHVVMDGDTYEEVRIPAELVGDAKVYLKADTVLQIAFVDGNPVLVELPNVVELKVVDTPPEVRGATATNQMKEANCEGGARIRVPAFIENGEVIRVDTRTNEYLGRA